MINRYVLTFAVFLVIIVCSSYVWNFYFRLNYTISNETGVWGAMGDYVGGLLNPAFSFFSLVLLIKSLRLQNQANLELSNQIKKNEKNEKVRSFEVRLFNMIDSQKESFNSLKIKIKANRKNILRNSNEAVIEIENEITRLWQVGASHQEIIDFLEEVDSKDQLYSATRIFYTIVKLISENLSDALGFNVEDRKSYFLTLINFTDFPLLRLVLISMRFLEFPSTTYLKNNEEFTDVLKDVGLDYTLY